MTAPKSEQKWINYMTWGEFIELAGPRGVRVKESESKIKRPDGKLETIQYLSRMDGDEERIVTLPSHFKLEDQMGAWVFESVCRRLNISTRFEGWAFLL